MKRTESFKQESHHSHHREEEEKKEQKKTDPRPATQRPQQVYVPPRLPSMDRTQSISKPRKDVKIAAHPRIAPKSTVSKRSTSFNRSEKKHREREKVDISRSMPKLEKVIVQDDSKKHVMSVSLVSKHQEQKPPIQAIQHVVNKPAPVHSTLKTVDERASPPPKARERDRPLQVPQPSAFVKHSPRTNKEELQADGSPQRELQRTPRPQSTPPREKEHREDMRRNRSQANMHHAAQMPIVLPGFKPVDDDLIPRKSPDEAADRFRLEQNIKERVDARHRARNAPFDPEEDTLFEIPMRMPVIDLVRI
ncbi:unnamed protein product, partial [Mesorhabditis belari]|uniref:Uncharacterized protein n=1 Tax=Mesorhabditis belari TaxID=2138241 RepID=A0AAF3J292_9BILA